MRTGSLVFLSGAGPVRPDGTFVTGKVGHDVDLDAAKEAARLTGLQLLAVLRAELGSLDRGRTGREDPRHGELRAGLQPDAGRHRRMLGAASRGLRRGRPRSARSAVGMAELPFDIAVEVELVVEIAD